MKNFDKIVLAFALAIFAFIFSDNIGRLFYGTKIAIQKPGYEIEIKSNQESSSDAPATSLAEILDMKSIMSNTDTEKGSEIFRKCAVCHTDDKTGANKVGPNLWNIVGSITAHKTDFSYSDAMLKRKEEQKSWTYEELYRYLYAPKIYVSGTKMAFAGIKNDQDRANLVAYLRTMSDSPLPLP